MKDEEEKVNLLFPPWKLMGRFLLVTMLLILGTAFSGGMVFNIYIQLTPEWEVGVLFLTIVIFCIVNFRVTRGSFICAHILKYYAIFLACINISSLLMGNDKIFTLINTALTLIAFFLISGETYQKLVQYQLDFFDDIKEAKEAVEKEIAMLNKSKRS